MHHKGSNWCADISSDEEYLTYPTCKILQQWTSTVYHLIDNYLLPLFSTFSPPTSSILLILSPPSTLSLFLCIFLYFFSPSLRLFPILNYFLTLIYSLLKTLTLKENLGDDSLSCQFQSDRLGASYSSWYQHIIEDANTLGRHSNCQGEGLSRLD